MQRMLRFAAYTRSRDTSRRQYDPIYACVSPRYKHITARQGKQPVWPGVHNSPCYQNVYFSFYIQPTCGAQAHMLLTTISSNPSSIVITGPLFLLTLIRSSFSSLDSRPTIQTPFHSCSFVPLRSNLQPPQLFRYVTLPSSLLHTQQTNISRFHHIRQAPSFSRHRPNIQTAHAHAVTVHIPHKNDISGDYIIIFSLKTKIEKKMIFVY